MVSPAIALLYPTLLASLAANPNRTLFADERGTLYIIDTTEPDSMQIELQNIKDNVLKTTLQLYTRNNPQVGQPLNVGDKESVKKSFWNPAHPTCFVIHGWRGDTEAGSACASIRDAYLSIGDYNVILVDWRKAAESPLYWEAVQSVPLVAERVTKLIDFLQSEANLNPSNTKIIGHSLGGHLAGIAARFAKSKIAEIIALDPAKPLFTSKGPGERVDKTDGNKVHVIHTSTLGLEESLGDADFYPNGGKDQPGCGFSGLGCSHSRSHKYYAESIRNPRGFRAGKVFMGGPTLDPNAHGTYVLQTAKQPPFALG
ncbi:lipase member H-A-like [Pogonomyrmex barbatus]|uniref:phospholipase A1 n=1 Tax=Pogonomyrmex barbatus TaxID=144034 RepID=A0A6I9W0J5_9HYME|nr:lipase member H-A-like [Pogonomyrmex barbatus]